MTPFFYEGVGADSYIPAWFEVGVYARYKLSGVTHIEFVNESFYDFEPFNAFFRWEVVEFDGHVALLEVSFTFDIVIMTNSVYVDVENRDIRSLEDELLGKTCFWLPPHPEKGERVVLFGNPDNYLNGTVRYTEYTTDSPQGIQKMFNLEVEFKGRPEWFFYDLNTGLPLHGYLREGGEAMLLALGISEVNMPFELEATNIDLGPPSFKFFIMTTLLKVAPVVLFIVAVTIYYRKKRLAQV